LITGATSGIGRALAVKYAAPGVHLALTGRNAERLAATRAECERRGATVFAETIDVRSERQIAEWIYAADDIFPIDLAIAGAGLATGVSLGRLREHADAARDVISTNILGLINTVDPIISRMLPRDHGQIALVGSLAGYVGLPYSPAYCASKAAVHTYAKALRANLVNTGITVSLVTPGFVTTSMNENAIFPKPLEMTAERAAIIIRSGLDRRRKVIRFPRLLYYGTKLTNLVSEPLLARILGRIEVDFVE